MRFANPAGWWMLLGIIPVIAIHILRPRRRSEVVSSTFLWEQVDTPVTSAKPIQRLRPSWLLLLQLLAVVLAACALANPVRTEPSQFAAHTVFMVDASGSMHALDGGPDRIADARQAAIEMRNELPEGAIASLVEMGPKARVLVSASPDPDQFASAAATIRPTDGSADFAGAFDLARGLETADASIGFVLVSDGGLSPDQQRGIPDGTVYRAVGSESANRGIIDLLVEPREGGLHVITTIANTGGPSATQTLRLDVDGRTRERVELTIPDGETVTHESDLAVGDQVEAYLEGEDLLPADNRRSAVTRQRSTVTVQVIGRADPFVGALLGSIDGVTVIDDSAPEPGETESAANDQVEVDSEADLVVFDGVDVPADIDTPFIAIAPPDGLDPELDQITAGPDVERPVPSLIRADDSLLQGLDFRELAIGNAQTVTAATADVLIGAESAPLLLRGRTQGGVPYIYLSFAPKDSNLPVLVAYPILGDRLITELTGASVPPTDVEVGDELTVPGFEGGYVIDPVGNQTDVPPGRSAVVTDRPGVWSVSNGRTVNQVAVNPAAAESTLEPVTVLPIAKRVPRAGEETPVSATSLRPWFVAALAVVLLAEFLLSRRRVGVTRRQWQLANVARVATAVALVLAALGIGIDRSSGSVATVFVIDLSDSMGSTGRADAVQFVGDALDSIPVGDRAAVVGFGGDARIENLLSEEVAFSRPSTVVDTSATDVAAALRLGGALLPSDSRRRVVLVSDGIATEGNAADEAQRLAAAGISVDTITIDTPGASDVAIASVNAPSEVDVGQSIPIEVRVESSTAARATVRLRRDGEVVDTKTVDVQPGTNTVSFTDTAASDAAGAQRYAAEVSSDRDAVGQNNTVYAAVNVNGAPRVLVVEGVPDNANNLSAALDASSINSDVVPVGSLPRIDELMGYSSIVLVDVDQRMMTTQQVGALTGAVRDGGRGLVTIGGDQSYGLGGYYTSELEGLLPVISEILDPKRRQSVAQVLAIDTSGSMAACHCAEGQARTNRADGGIVKTDIARSAAARTISALSANDEVGVLGFDINDKWLIDLQKLPSQNVVNSGLSTIRPNGDTNPATTLETAARALRSSNASLKHIIMFTDGFTSQALLEDMADQAEALAAEGITVSVVATGEGAAKELSAIANSGNGRFYPGRDLQMIPQIIMDEAVLASRDFIQEGTFFPTVRSSRPVVANLTETPPLLGYIATTPKPTATMLLTVGPDDDPLLASWKAGLGTVTSWTSDASDRWSQGWAAWDGYVPFWSGVVRDTFPTESAGSTATIEDGQLKIRVEGDDTFADGSAATATITDPTYGRVEIPLTRVGANAFAGEVAADQVGTYVVGTSVTSPDGSDPTIGSTLANVSYSPEYLPGPPDTQAMQQIAGLGDGRYDITPDEAFDATDLAAASRHVDLTTWWIVAAGVLMLVAMVLSRLNLERSTARLGATEPASSRARAVLARVPTRRANTTATAKTPAAANDKPVPSTASVEERKQKIAVEADRRVEAERQRAETATLDALLAQRRRSRDE